MLIVALHQAPRHARCSWYAQFPYKERRIIFLPYAYLRSPLPNSIDENVTLRIIDEKYLGAITWKQRIFVDEWLASCSCASAGGTGATHCIHAARRLVLDVLLTRRSIIEVLQAAGYTRIHMHWFEKEEKADQPELHITPLPKRARTFAEWDRSLSERELREGLERMRQSPEANNLLA